MHLWAFNLFDLLLRKLDVEVLKASQFLGTATNDGRPVHKRLNDHQQTIEIKCVTCRQIEIAVRGSIRAPIGQP